MELNTTNPHCFTYKTDEFLMELLGGVRIGGLDRMRVPSGASLVQWTVPGKGGKPVIVQNIANLNLAPVIRIVIPAH